MMMCVSTTLTHGMRVKRESHLNIIQRSSLPMTYSVYDVPTLVATSAINSFRPRRIGSYTMGSTKIHLKTIERKHLFGRAPLNEIP